VYGVTLNGKVRLVYRDVGAVVLHDVSRDGRVLLGHESERRGIIATTPDEPQGRDLSWFDRSFARDLSADGKAILFDESGEGGGPEHSVFLRQLDGSPPVRLADGFGVAISPDGKWALVRGREALNAVPTGAGEAHTLHAESPAIFGAGWFPDGKRVFFSSGSAAGERKAFVADFPQGSPKQISPESLLPTFSSLVVMPDGKSVALTATVSGRCSLQPVDGGAARPIACPNGSVAGVSGDGKSWYVREPGVPAKLYRADILTGRKELWKEIHPPDPAGTYRMDNFLVTPDGKNYVYTYRRILSDLYLVEGLK
jgi:hypothetical protein